MNDRHLDQLLNAWMDLGPTTAPDRVADAARLEARATRQMPAVLDRWAPRRFPKMSNTVRIALAAAAVLVIAFLGIRSLLPGSNVGGPNAPSGPTSIPETIPNQTSLTPGSYAIDDAFPVRITLDVPAGWFAWISNAEVAGLMIENDEDTGSGWGPAFWIVDNVRTDPCDSSSELDPPLGSSVDDLVTALTSLPGYEATAPTDVTVSGFSGVEFELTAPEYGEECADHLTWTTAGSEPRGMMPGELNRIQILDVDGVRLVITIVEYAHTTEIEQADGIPFDADDHAADQPELRQILDSVRLESRP